MTNKKNAQKGTKGVKVNLTEDSLTLDIYLLVKFGQPIPEVAENVQKSVAAAVEAMTGRAVQTINIHVGGVTMG